MYGHYCSLNSVRFNIAVFFMMLDFWSRSQCVVCGGAVAHVFN